MKIIECKKVDSREFIIIYGFSFYVMNIVAFILFSIMIVMVFIHSLWWMVPAFVIGGMLFMFASRYCTVVRLFSGFVEIKSLFRTRKITLMDKSIIQFALDYETHSDGDGHAVPTKRLLLNVNYVAHPLTVYVMDTHNELENKICEINSSFK